jgi:hypothetical protein
MASVGGDVAGVDRDHFVVAALGLHKTPVRCTGGVAGGAVIASIGETSQFHSLNGMVSEIASYVNVPKLSICSFNIFPLSRPLSYCGLGGISYFRVS